MRPPRRSPRRRSRSPLGAIVVLACIAALAALVALVAPTTTLRGEARAVDGDTLNIAGTPIRLVGFDAVELDQTCLRDGTEWPCGREARAHLADLVAGREAVCVSAGRDRYRRELARCEAGDGDLGAAMVRAGWAVADPEYALALAEARLGHRGIWNSRFDDPAVWRRTRGEGDADPWSWLWRWFGA